MRDPGPAADYIHGFSVEEQRRLVTQAAVLAPSLFADLDLAVAGEVLEIGCGVGAELRHMTGRWRRPRCWGLDRSVRHLNAAAEYLRPEREAGRVVLVRGDGVALPFAPGVFDRVLTIWMLEHVPNPAAVMREALRVLRPEGRLICTEVDNATFGFAPARAAIEAWWAAFNRYQQRAGGDPFVGRRLADTAARLGCRDIRARSLPIISSAREPGRRRELLAYLEDLLLSGADNMLRDGYADRRDLEAVRADFARVRSGSEVEFRYSAVRMTCRPAIAEPRGRDGLPD